tara:strand:- start:23134 stop:23382 length:249 start_codon:yes stop_codon:yes gene_type:complete
LHAYLAQQGLPTNTQLPPERELCDVLVALHAKRRKALALLVSNSEWWRHVSKGTSIDQRPTDESVFIYEHAAARAALHYAAK